MADVGLATPDGPARRRESWSLKTLVEDIAGRPISELQDPTRPEHPYLKVKGGGGPYRSAAAPALPAPSRAAVRAEAETDPVDRYYPPFVGEAGRALHAPEHHHHEPTLRSIASAAEEPMPGHAVRAPGPSQRPERIYLHYLLLHLDRLSDHALRYLGHAVDEELRHRASSASETTPSPPSP